MAQFLLQVHYPNGNIENLVVHQDNIAQLVLQPPSLKENDQREHLCDMYFDNHVQGLLGQAAVAQTK